MAGCSPRMKKAMGGMAMTRPGFPSRGPASGGMTRPGFMVKPRPVRMKKGGMVGGAGSGVGREMKTIGKGVRRKGSCGKNS